MEETQTTEIAQKRPLVLTIIAWLIIIGTLLAPISIYMMVTNPQMKEMMEMASKIPATGQLILMIIGALVGFWAAIGMLKGKKIARTVYVVYTIIAFIITFIASNMKESLIGTILISAVILGLLYLPNINRYFDQNDA